MNIAFFSIHYKEYVKSHSPFIYAVIEELAYTNNVKWIGVDACNEVRRLHNQYYDKSTAFVPLNYKDKIVELLSHEIKSSHYHLILEEEAWMTSSLASFVPSLVVTHNERNKRTAFRNANRETQMVFYGDDHDTVSNIVKSINALDMNKEEKNPIPIFAVNLKQRPERRRHIIGQFEGRKEFDFTVLDAIEDESPRLGLWKSLCMTVRMAKERRLDYFIFCEDDHIFTEHYDEHYLRDNIEGALAQKADLLCGGIGGTDLAVPVSKNRFCMGCFCCTQFVVIYKRLYDTILNYLFVEGDTADGVLSVIAHSKMTVYPFLSRQRSFGYSDVTPQNNEYDIENYFNAADEYLGRLHEVSLHYNYPWAR